ncbi:hypothetical protein PsYK624_145920 [Phanerochaete sordida]|uniref:Uncharacterized protein n=1 Tax=Phanerochaete sordida TaxID=48140 RepID=A0A9P3GNV1_9APHY|nr:hypothetical protein PsYK624_145920 [Phanerochaete sordida]
MDQSSIELQREFRGYQIGRTSDILLLGMARRIAPCSMKLTQLAALISYEYVITFDQEVANYPLAAFLLIVSSGQLALFSGLRVYALWRSSRFRYILFAIVVLLGLVPSATNSYNWARTQVEYQGYPFYACSLSVNVTEELNTIALFHPM